MIPEPTIFVVDDDPAMRESLKTLFDAFGDRCRMFASAEEFLDVYNPDWPAAVSALQQGAMDFVQKPFAPNLLLERVHTAIDRDREQRKQSLGTAEVSRKLVALSPREKDVLKLIIAGEPTKNIARTLGTSYNTVKHQRASILKKLEADSVIDVVRMVAEHDKL
jgi:FixJ family two-component response regulator